MVKPAYDAPLDSFIPGNKTSKKKLLVRKPSTLVNDPLKTQPKQPKSQSKPRNEKPIMKSKPNKPMNRVQKSKPQPKQKVVVQKVIEKVVYVNEKGQKIAPPKTQKSQAVVSRTRTQRRRDSRAKLANQKSTLTKVTSSQGEISVVTDLRKQIEVRKKQHGVVEKRKPGKVKPLVKKNRQEQPKKVNSQKKQLLKRKKQPVKEKVVDSDDDYEQVSRPVKNRQGGKKKERVQLEESSNGALTDKGLKRWKNDNFVGDARSRIPSREDEGDKSLSSTKFGIQNDIMVMPKKLTEDEMVEVDPTAVSYFHRISNSDGNDRPAHSKTISPSTNKTTRMFH